MKHIFDVRMCSDEDSHANDNPPSAIIKRRTVLIGFQWSTNATSATAKKIESRIFVSYWPELRVRAEIRWNEFLDSETE